MNSFLSWAETHIDLPSLVLVALLSFALWIFWAAQRIPDNNFDLKDILRDPEGKLSPNRVASLVCLALTSWGFMYHVINTQGKVDVGLFLGYASVWSGVAVVAKAVEAYGSRGSSYAPPPATPESERHYASFPVVDKPIVQAPSPEPTNRYGG